MKVTQPMIDRGLQAMRIDMGPNFANDREMVEAILRAALNDPKVPVEQIEGQMEVGDFVTYG